jgi:hypothetical protein
MTTIHNPTLTRTGDEDEPVFAPICDCGWHGSPVHAEAGRLSAMGAESQALSQVVNHRQRPAVPYGVGGPFPI